MARDVAKAPPLGLGLDIRNCLSLEGVIIDPITDPRSPSPQGHGLLPPQSRIEGWMQRYCFWNLKTPSIQIFKDTIKLVQNDILMYIAKTSRIIGLGLTSLMAETRQATSRSRRQSFPAPLESGNGDIIQSACLTKTRRISYQGKLDELD